MALVISNRRLSFSDEEGTHTAVPLDRPQIFPDRFLGDPYFKAAQQSRWIEVVNAPEAAPVDSQSSVDVPEVNDTATNTKKQTPRKQLR